MIFVCLCRDEFGGLEAQGGFIRSWFVVIDRVALLVGLDLIPDVVGGREGRRFRMRGLSGGRGEEGGKR